MVGDKPLSVMVSVSAPATAVEKMVEETKVPAVDEDEDDDFGTFSDVTPLLPLLELLSRNQRHTMDLGNLATLP